MSSRFSRNTGLFSGTGLLFKRFTGALDKIFTGITPASITTSNVINKRVDDFTQQGTDVLREVGENNLQIRKLDNDIKDIKKQLNDPNVTSLEKESLRGDMIFKQKQIEWFIERNDDLNLEGVTKLKNAQELQATNTGWGRLFTRQGAPYKAIAKFAVFVGVFVGIPLAILDQWQKSADELDKKIIEDCNNGDYYSCMVSWFSKNTGLDSVTSSILFPIILIIMLIIIFVVVF